MGCESETASLVLCGLVCKLGFFPWEIKLVAWGRIGRDEMVTDLGFGRVGRKVLRKREGRGEMFMWVFELGFDVFC